MRSVPFCRVRSQEQTAVLGELDARSAMAAEERSGVHARLRGQPRCARNDSIAVQSGADCHAAESDAGGRPLPAELLVWVYGAGSGGGKQPGADRRLSDGQRVAARSLHWLRSELDPLSSI